LQDDYTTIGHVTVDVLQDGSRRPGGSAFYAALQAARLGLRARILTRGVPAEIQALLEPFREELELEVLPAPHTTTLLTSGSGAGREQRMLAWAGTIEWPSALETAILHLAPVARETPTRWRGRHELLGLTPQGLVREWDRTLVQGGAGEDAGEGAGAGEGEGASEDAGAGEGEGAIVRLGSPAGAQRELAARCDALVLAESERESCAALIDAAAAAGATVAITAGAAGKTLLMPDGQVLRLEVVPARAVRDDLGAGDVFAAAFFVALREGRPAREAARFASAAAALRIEGTGAGAIATRARIERRLAEVEGSARPEASPQGRERH
jgi:hypothetical protein